jgi:hypothetical protein
MTDKPDDLPEPLREVLGGLPRQRFSREPPRSKAESESDMLFEVRDLPDLLARLDQRRLPQKK